MKKQQTRILLKITGEVFKDRQTGKFSAKLVLSLVKQIKVLSSKYQFGIVIGGGNLFRDLKQAKSLRIRQSVAIIRGLQIKAKRIWKGTNAQTYKQKIRVFKIFKDNALINTANEIDFGSFIE